MDKPSLPRNSYWTLWNVSVQIFIVLRHHFHLHCHILRKTGDKVELLAVKLWTSHGQLFLCHQHTLPMLVKRVVEGGYMVSVELCCFGGAMRAGHQLVYKRIPPSKPECHLHRTELIPSGKRQSQH